MSGSHLIPEKMLENYAPFVLFPFDGFENSYGCRLLSVRFILDFLVASMFNRGRENGK